MKKEEVALIKVELNKHIEDLKTTYLKKYQEINQHIKNTDPDSLIQYINELNTLTVITCANFTTDAIQMILDHLQENDQ